MECETLDMFFFDEDRLNDIAAASGAAYRSAEPFPHVVIDDFLPADALARIIDEFPGPRDVEWQRFEADRRSSWPPITAG